MEFIDKSDIMKGIGPDTTADLLEKSMGHKYFKREGTPGNYKYYYTEEEYNKAKGKKTEDKETNNPETIENDGKKYKLQPNGKYLEVSEQGMTKKQHEDKGYYHKVKTLEKTNNTRAAIEQGKHLDKMDEHFKIASKLSNKEFTREELEEEDKPKESSSSGVRIGQEVKIPANLTSDPLKKQGELGKVLSIDKDIVTIKFSDGKSGKYFRDIFE